MTSAVVFDTNARQFQLMKRNWYNKNAWNANNFDRRVGFALACDEKVVKRIYTWELIKNARCFLWNPWNELTIIIRRWKRSVCGDRRWYYWRNEFIFWCLRFNFWFSIFISLINYCSILQQQKLSKTHQLHTMLQEPDSLCKSISLHKWLTLCRSLMQEMLSM